MKIKQLILIDEHRNYLLQFWQAYQENKNPLLEKVSIIEPSADLVLEIREDTNVQDQLGLRLLCFLLIYFDNKWLARLLRIKQTNGLR